MYGIKHDRSFEREKVYWALPSVYDKTQKGLTVKDIKAKTGIEPKIISECLQTLKHQGLARRYSGNRWRRTHKI